jgi:rhodanese-related sulfurtransferase
MRNGTTQELEDALASGGFVIDVRTPPEFEAGHVAGAVLVPLVSLPMRMSELPVGQPVYVICESGARSFQACQFLAQQGMEAVNVIGGMAAWRSEGRPAAR